MRENGRLFDGLAEAYDAWRPAYPQVLFDRLAAESQGGVRCAIDVGAGTGLSTQNLLNALGPNWLIVAIEPGADMRRVLSRRFRGVPNVQVLDAWAEDMHLPNQAASLLVAGTAYHFFTADQFFSQAARVLVPGGVLALIRNRRIPTPVTRRFDAYIQANSPVPIDLKQRERLKEPTVRVLAGLTDFRAVQSCKESWQNELDCRGLIDLYLTRAAMTGVVRTLGLARVMADLSAICAECSGSLSSPLSWETTMKWARRR